MSREEFDDNCDDCKPALIDTQTGKMLPDDHFVMQTLMGIWEEASLEERQAFHNVTCKNSRNPQDLSLAEQIAKRLMSAVAN
jgi:hypothetical protein